MRDDVDGLVSFAVVHTREFGVVAQLVVYLNALHRLCGQRLDGCRYILAEELLAVDKYLLYLLALSLYCAVGDGNAGHLLQQPLDVGVGRNLESLGVVAYRVALLRGAHGLYLLDDGLDLCRRLGEGDAPEVGRGSPDLEVVRLVLIAEERYDHLVAAVFEAAYCGRTLVARGVVTLLFGVVCWHKFYYGASYALVVGGVGDGERYLACLCVGRNAECGAEQYQKHFFHICIGFSVFVEYLRRKIKGA